MPPDKSPDAALLRKWVETWKRAGEELESIGHAELESVDTKEAVRQIFGNWHSSGMGPPTSGLVEQQAWFARIRLKHERE